MPQLLKAEWRGSQPSAVQLPFESGDSYANRVSEHASSRPSMLINRTVPEGGSRAADSYIIATPSQQQQHQQQRSHLGPLGSEQNAKTQRTTNREREHPASLAAYEDR